MKKSKFDLSHERIMNMRPDGTLYPILCEDCMPGDVWKGNSQIFARMSPLVSPIYQRFDVYVHYFFVPYELVWKNWRQFISPEHTDAAFTEGIDNPVFPAFSVGQVGDPPTDFGRASRAQIAPGTLADYLGIRINNDDVSDAATNPMFSMLPFRAYQLIWNEHYRDPDLQEKIQISREDGVNLDPATPLNAGNETYSMSFRQKNLEKDYFNSSRPFAQKGNPVTVMTHGAPITDTNGVVLFTDSGEPMTSGLTLKSESANFLSLGFTGTSADATGANIDSFASFTIEDLRYGNAMQKFLEKIYRSGNRYTNYLRSFFGVKGRDQRLDRPEYIGGGRQPFNISEVLQTSQSDTTPLGTYGGRGITYSDHSFRYEVMEHGVIMGLVSITPRVSYMHGVRKQFLHTDRFDFPIPDFAHLGNQEIKSIEATGITDDATSTFGYTDRYGEYKFIPSTVHGLFRTDAYLKTFHASRNVVSPNIASDMITVNSLDVARVFASNDLDDSILVACQNRITAIRPLPRLSVPGLF